MFICFLQQHIYRTPKTESVKFEDIAGKFLVCHGNDVNESWLAYPDHFMVSHAAITSTVTSHAQLLPLHHEDLNLCDVCHSQ